MRPRRRRAGAADARSATDFSGEPRRPAARRPPGAPPPAWPCDSGTLFRPETVRKRHGRAAGGGPKCDGIATIACEKIPRAPSPQGRNARISALFATPRRRAVCDGVANSHGCDGKSREFARDSALRRRVAAPGRRDPRISARSAAPRRARCDTRRMAPRRDGRNRRIARDAAMRRRVAAASRRSNGATAAHEGAAASAGMAQADGGMVGLRRVAGFGPASVARRRADWPAKGGGRQRPPDRPPPCPPPNRGRENERSPPPNRGRENERGPPPNRGRVRTGRAVPKKPSPDSGEGWEGVPAGDPTRTHR
jgi:hypothetical protein